MLLASATATVPLRHLYFGVEISLRSFFNAPTVADLSEVVVQALLEADDVEGILDELEVA